MRSSRYEIVMSTPYHKRTRSYVRDWVHEWDCDFDRFGDQVLDFTKHGQVVLGLDIIWISGVQASNEATERRDSHTLADAEHRYNVESNFVVHERE